jgi:predicted ATPase
VVTFLFTDIEGSTRLWQEDGTAMRTAIARHDEMLHSVIADHRGVVFSATGDGLAAAFHTASAALSCAVEAQRLLASEPWETARPLKVRMGLHTGEAELRDGSYFGTAVNRAARLAAAGHGGQIVCSSATAQVADAGVTLTDLGEHRLRDLDQPVRVSQVGGGSYPPLRSLNAFPGNLPVQLTSFVGRQGELASVAAAFQAARLVTVTGTGGVGKTRLAVHAAASLVTGFPDGAWLCELAPAAEPESMLRAVAAALGYAPAAGADPERGLAAFIGTRRMLLILDNCEHLLDPAAALAATVLERCAGTAILATSREALGADGERIIRLRSLPVPPPGASLQDLAGADASRLFLDRADATGAELTLGPDDGRAIAEICHRLDGIPLAIELAAARVIALSPGEIASHLDERFRLLTGGRRAAVERHHTMRAAIDWSYSLLSHADQAVFTHLGVFPASFDTPAAQAVAAASGAGHWDVLDALASLVAKSLLIADRGAGRPTRYQMLETLRHYARERLDAAGSADEARRAHARHYAAAAAQIGSGLRGLDEASWRSRVHAEVENLQAAVTWSLDATSDDDGELAMVILGELGPVTSRGRVAFFPGADHENAVERARRTGSRHASLVIAGAAVTAYLGGDFRRGRDLAREARRGVLASPHPGTVLNASLAFASPGNLAAELADGLRILHEAGASTWEHARLHGAAAAMAATVGSTELARQEATTALQMGRQLGSPSVVGLGLYGFGLASWQADPAAARTALEEYLAVARTFHYEGTLARALALLAQLHAQEGNLPAALALLQEAIESAHLQGDQPALAACLARGAVVIAAAGDNEMAAMSWGAVADGVFAGLTVLPPNEIPAHAQFLAALQAQLGDDRYMAATATGAALTYEQVTPRVLSAVKNLSFTART